MIFDKVEDRIDLFFSAVGRLRPANSVKRGLNPNRKEFCIKSPLFHPEGVDMPIGESLIDIDTFINHTLRCVCVHINGDRMSSCRWRINNWLGRCQRRVITGMFIDDVPVSFNRMTTAKNSGNHYQQNSPAWIFQRERHVKSSDVT